MTYRSNALGCLVATVLLAQAAAGQSASSTTVTVSGGWTSLTEQSSQLRDAGAHVQLGVSRQMQSLVSSRLRFDIGYHSIPPVADPRRGAPSSSVWIVTGSLVKNIGLMRRSQPYLVAGAGAISIDEGDGRVTHLDVAGGVGLVLPQISRIRPFVEARYHRVMQGRSRDFIPLSLGFTF